MDAAVPADAEVLVVWVDAEVCHGVLDAPFRDNGCEADVWDVVAPRAVMADAGADQMGEAAMAEWVDAVAAGQTN